MSEATGTALHLIDDEAMEIAGSRCPIRIRIWAAQGRAPVVLASMSGGPRGWPSRFSTQAADLAFGPMLGFPAAGMHYFERIDGMYFRVTFGPLGYVLRMRHADPRRRAVNRHEIERLIGSEIGD